MFQTRPYLVGLHVFTWPYINFLREQETFSLKIEILHSIYILMSQYSLAIDIVHTKASALLLTQCIKLKHTYLGKDGIRLGKLC